MSQLKKFQKFEYFLFGIITILIIGWSKDNFFFWDAVQLTSKHAHWFYENGFSIFFLPQEFDSGHPPFWGMYHALLWKIFGKNLAVSHFAIFPFLFGSMVMASKIGKILLKNDALGWYFGLFLIADPVFLTQSIIVSPDIALIFFFLLSLFGILKTRKFNGYLVLGCMGLAMVSLRGMMTLAGLGVFTLLITDFRKNIPQLAAFIPGIVVGFGFLLAHSLHTQWIGYHENSPWADSFQRVNIQGVFKNIVVFGWRMLDYGRIFLYIGLLYIGIKSNFGWIKKTKPLIQLFFVLSIFLLPTFFLYKGLNAMRYLLPMMIVIDFIFLQAVLNWEKEYKDRSVLYGMVFLGLVLGNTWIYPKTISMSWDSTLRHVPYYELRKKMLNFIHTSKIPLHEIGTAFPNDATLEEIDLSGKDYQMTTLDDPKAKYYFISNIMNDARNDRPRIQKACRLVKRYEKWGIFVEFYGRD